jgi:hypothetical protein
MNKAVTSIAEGAVLQKGYTNDKVWVVLGKYERPQQIDTELFKDSKNFRLSRPDPWRRNLYLCGPKIEETCSIVLVPNLIRHYTA